MRWSGGCKDRNPLRVSHNCFFMNFFKFIFDCTLCYLNFFRKRTTFLRLYVSNCCVLCGFPRLLNNVAHKTGVQRLHRYLSIERAGFIIQRLQFLLLNTVNTTVLAIFRIISELLPLAPQITGSIQIDISTWFSQFNQFVVYVYFSSLQVFRVEQGMKNL